MGIILAPMEGSPTLNSADASSGYDKTVTSLLPKR